MGVWKGIQMVNEKNVIEPDCPHEGEWYHIDNRIKICLNCRAGFKDGKFEQYVDENLIELAISTRKLVEAMRGMTSTYARKTSAAHQENAPPSYGFDLHHSLQRCGKIGRKLLQAIGQWAVRSRTQNHG